MRWRMQKSFTLIELLIVIMILSIMFAVTTMVFSEMFTANRGDVAKEKIMTCLHETRNLVSVSAHFLAIDQMVSHIHFYDTDSDGYFEAFAAHNAFPGERVARNCRIPLEGSEAITYHMPPNTGIEIPGTISGSPDYTDGDSSIPMDTFWFCGLKMRSVDFRKEYFKYYSGDANSGISFEPQSKGVCYVFDKKTGKRLYRIEVYFYTETITITPIE